MVTHPVKQQQQTTKNAYQAFYEEPDRSPVMGYDGSLEEHDDEEIEMGLAIDTRNYQALLKKNAPANHSSSSSGGDRQRYSYSQPPPRYSSILTREGESAILSAAGDAEEDVVIDRTVKGLPIETRNYQVLLFNQGREKEPPLVGVAVSANHKNAKYALNHRSSSNNTDGEEVDAVLGLPINTGNYAARGKGKGKEKNHRSRGYSDLAGVAERRVSAPAIPGKRSSAQYATAPVESKQQPRASCFDTRRGSTVAVVPQTGWLFIQSKTFKSWKKYYAVLSGLEFRYSKGPGHPPKGFGTVHAVQRWDGMLYGIKLVLSSGMDIPVYCESEADVDEWMTAFQKSLEKSQSQSENTKTSYTLTASEQHEGYLFRHETRAGTWRRYFFAVRIDGYIECKATEDASAVDGKHSGYIESVSFADEHPNGIAIQLDSGSSVLVYADTYDERMLWYAAMSSAAMANDRTPHIATSVKSTYVQTARANHAGWMHKQAGLFKSWKRFYFTLHGSELSFSKGTNSSVVLCDNVHSIEDWDGKQNGLQIRLKSGRVWKVYADSYDSAKRWRTLIANATRRGGDHFSAKRYLASRKRKGLPAVFGGWLTNVKDEVTLRQFYVVDGKTMGFANEVDHQLQQIGSVVNVGASRDLTCGIVVTFANGSKLKLAADSIESYKSWYEILNAPL